MTSQEINYGNVERLTGKPIDPVLWFLQRVPYLVEQARSLGRQDAHSYRDFHVAGAIAAINPAERTYWEDAAGNLKRSNKSKVCAEKKLLGRALKHGFPHVIGLVVLSTTDRAEIKAVSDLETPTLHFCGVCRDEVPQHQCVADRTLVVTSGLNEDVNQTFTVGQVASLYPQALHGDSAAAFELTRSRPDFHDWDQRIATYQMLTNGPEAVNLALEERQRLAQLALSKTVSI